MYGTNLVGEHYEEEHRGFIAFVLFGFSLLAFAWTILYSLKYVEYNTLNKKGNITTAQIVKRIRVPDSKIPTQYFFTYEYTNSSSSNDCAKSGSYFTTPRKQACQTTVQAHRIVKEQYDSIRVGDPVEVLYLPNVEKTKSVVIGEYLPKKSYIAKIIISLFISLLFGRLTWALATAKRSA